MPLHQRAVVTAHQRAVVTYDFESLSIHLYDGSQHSTIPLTPQQCILLAQQLLTNALLCQSHMTQEPQEPESNSAPADTTPTSAVA